jgi:hypothetical protein
MKLHTTYTQEMADHICAELAGGKSLRSICKEEGMPHRDTVFLWLRQQPEFAAQYALAKRESADAHFDELMFIADEAPHMTLNKHGAEVVDNGYETFRRTRIDTRKWAASKLGPKKYGDKLEVDANVRGTIVVTIAREDEKV